MALKKYEMISIIKPNLDMDEVEKVINTLDETIKKYDGNVISIDKLGRKKLAYEILNFRDGFFVVLNIELAADKVVDLKRYIKLNENFLREMMFEVTKKAKVAAK